MKKIYVLLLVVLSTGAFAQGPDHHKISANSPSEQCGQNVKWPRYSEQVKEPPSKVNKKYLTCNHHKECLESGAETCLHEPVDPRDFDSEVVAVVVEFYCDDVSKTPEKLFVLDVEALEPSVEYELTNQYGNFQRDQDGNIDVSKKFNLIFLSNLKTWVVRREDNPERFCKVTPKKTSLTF